MIVFGKRFFLRIYLLVSKVHWVWLPATMLAIFLLSWASMAYFEGDAPIAQKDNYWWYFIVTSTTVGYGDLFPVTLGGRLTGASIMIGGIGLISALITKVTEAATLHTRKKLKGLLPLLNMKDHIVILGWNDDRTKALIMEILADTPEKGEKIVLCSNSLTENPMPGVIEFVQGSPAHDKTHVDAGTKTAKRVIVFGSNDNKTLAYAAKASRHAGKDVHIAAYFQNSEAADTLRDINSKVECVPSLSLALLVHAASDPGTTLLIGNLTSHNDQGTLYRVYIPQGFAGASYFSLLCSLKGHYDVTLMGIADSHDHTAVQKLNPPSDTRVTGGMSLFYVGNSRLDEAKINWAALGQVVQA